MIDRATLSAVVVDGTDLLIISLSITRINALLTGVSLSIATALRYTVNTIIVIIHNDDMHT